ncbi:MAG: hypothetical protein JO257_21080 [Deltaproteobacteria bacterium]|nr:hypothetical protein [Deltaproteobacteria bacterium]
MKALALLLLLTTVAHADGSGSAAGSGVVIQLPVDADAPEVSAAASPTELMLGSRFTLFVTAVYNTGVEVNLPAGFDLGDTFEIKKTTSEDHVRADGKHVREWQLDVVAWDLGDLRIPGVPVTFTINGHGGQILTNSIPLRVNGVLGDTDDPKLMRGNAPPVRLQANDYTWAWVGGVVFVLVAGGLTFWQLRRRRKQHVRTLVGGLAPARAQRLDMTSERALERLLAIETSGVLARDGDRKTGYADMVSVIRDYLAARYRFATAELTTSELMRGLAKRANAADATLVEAWLARCDLVKYGGVRATEAEALETLAGAREVVMKTTAMPTAAKEAA